MKCNFVAKSRDNLCGSAIVMGVLSLVLSFENSKMRVWTNKQKIIVWKKTLNLCLFLEPFYSSLQFLLCLTVSFFLSIVYSASQARQVLHRPARHRVRLYGVDRPVPAGSDLPARLPAWLSFLGMCSNALRTYT